MKVFLSWSGPTSRAVAEILREWLPEMIQAIKPWMSTEDIDRGTFWNSRLNEALGELKAGIICVTPDSQESLWLNFEAGALCRTVDKTMVCPYLFRIKTTELKWPLAQFQASVADKEDTFKLIKTLNSALDRDPLEETLLKKTFNRCWPDLESKLSKIKSSTTTPPQQRSPEELLEEILELARDQSRQSRQSEDYLLYLIERMATIGEQRISVNNKIVPPPGYVLDDDIPGNFSALEHLRSVLRHGSAIPAPLTIEPVEVDDEKPLNED